MRTNRLLLIIVGSLGCLLVGGSCKKPLDDEKREETKAAARREPNAALVGPDFDPVDPSVELGQVIKQLKLKTLITTDTIERLRSLLNEVARREGCDPMCVAARRAFDSELDQSVALGVVKLAFPDIPSKIALATQMPASRIRTSAVRHLCANELKGDLKGLRQFYEVMPVGEDRALVATEAAEVVLSDQGLSAGLDFIEKLEMPEERCSALQMANLSNTTGWKEEQNLQKFHKILDSLLPKDKKGMKPNEPHLFLWADLEDLKSPLGTGHDYRESLAIIKELGGNSTASLISGLARKTGSCLDPAKDKDFVTSLDFDEWKIMIAGAVEVNAPKAFELTLAGWDETHQRIACAEATRIWLEKDSMAACGRIMKMPSGELKDAAVTEMVNWLVEKNSEDQASAWISEISDPSLRDETKKRLMNRR